MATILSSFTQVIGIDLGSSMVRIWTPQAGVVVAEPAYLAIDSSTKKVLAVGTEARAMQGRVLKGVEILQPIRDGKVYDFHSAQALLKIFVQKIQQRIPFASKTIMVSVPANKTETSQNIVSDLMYSLGAGSVYTISQPLAASIGAGIPIADASGTIVVQFGADLVEAAVISLGSVITSSTSYKAGTYFNQRIQYLLRKKKNFEVAFEVAEKLKREIVSLDKNVQKKMLVAGKDSLKGNPREITLETKDLAPEALKLFDHYEQLIKTMLTRIPPELTVDIVDKGIILSGGGAGVDGSTQYFVDRLGVPVSVVDDAPDVVIKGIATALENLDEFIQSIGYRN